VAKTGARTGTQAPVASDLPHLPARPEHEPAVDVARIAAAVTEILYALGDDPHRPGLERTPERVAALIADLFARAHCDPAEVLIGETLAPEQAGPVLVRDLPFTSFCEHHLLPFRGRVHLAYIPCSRLAGIGALARVVDVVAYRLQIQERLTAQLADAIERGLEPAGVAVLVEAEHLCMILRGAQKEGARLVTTAFRGEYTRSPELRREFLAMVQRRDL
jgi:GTP cyclohydrolase I